jgi:molybdate transport system substrate-binding protein
MKSVRQKLHSGWIEVVTTKVFTFPWPGKGKNKAFFILFVPFFYFCIFGGKIGCAEDVVLSVAASLKDVIAEVARNYEKVPPGIRLIRNSGGSGALARQIENGAPADIFISANQEWVDYLREKNLLDSTRVRIFARNTLVFVGQKEASGLSGLKTLDKIAIGSPQSVPAGAYAIESLKKTDLYPALEKKLVLTRDVREALAYAERGEVDGAFVYKSDAILGQKAKILFSVPPHLHSQIIYPMAITLVGRNKPEAVRVFDFLQKQEVRLMLEKFGFLVP